MSAVFQAGAARACITPPVGTCLYGYRPDWHSESVHDDLSLTAAAFREGDASALLITVEVGDIHTALCDEMRAAIAEKTGVPASCILLCATHTHSAPNVSGMEGWGEIDRPFYETILLPAAVRAAKQAVDALCDAEIAVGTTQSLVGINRREIMQNGNVRLGQEPSGCFDPTMTCVSIRAKDGKGILNLLHYGCHGTTAGCNREISRDWSGVMIDRMERLTGTLTAFWNGAVGDVGPRLASGETCGDIRDTEELGGLAATDAMRAYQARGGFHTGHLQAVCDTVRLPYRPLPSLQAVQDKLREMGDDDTRINIDRLTEDHYRQLEALLQSGKTEHPTHFAFPVCLIALGDVLFIPFPYEIFSQIVLRLRRYIDLPYVLCLSNVNGYNGYFPSQDQIALGGYEVDCFRSGSLYTLPDNADQYLIEEILRIWEGSRDVSHRAGRD